METTFLSNLTTSSSKYGLKQPSYMTYGTAGFRSEATKLPLVCFRVGIMASLLSRKRGTPVGIFLSYIK